MLRKRGGKWYYTIETYDELGRRKRVERAGTPDKLETRRLQRQAQAEYEKTLRIRAGVNISYGDLLKDWLSSLPGSGLKVNTIKRYRSIVNSWLLPDLGKKPLKRITPRILQDYVNGLPLSHSSINSMVVAIKNSFRYGVVMCQYLPSSPADYLKVPIKREVREETIVFSGEEMDEIVSHFRKSDVGMAVYLAYYAGLRIGECCALEWEDVDLRKNELSIHSTLVKDDGWQLQEMPKTKGSIRAVQIPEKLHELLAEEHLRSMTRKLEYGPFYHDSPFVCRHADGSPLTPDGIRYFNRWCKKSLGHGSFHTLRHTYATALLEHGADLEMVSRQLGHASIVVTSTVYSHVLSRRKSRLSKILDKAL